MNWSRSCRQWAATGLTLAGAALAQSPNLIGNGDLEGADVARPDCPAGFTAGRIGTEPAEMTWESPGYESDRCLAVQTLNSSGLGYWQTVVPVKPATPYTLSFHYRTAPVTGQPTTGNPLYNLGHAGGPNLEFGALPAPRATPPTAWSDIGRALPPAGGLFLPVSDEWMAYRHTLTTWPDQTHLVVKFRLWCYAQKAWVDNLALTEGASPAPPPDPDPLWTAADTTPPVACAPQPPPNSLADPLAAIRIRLDDEGAGVDPASARLEVDGTDLTAKAVVAPDGLSFTPATPWLPGPHRVRVRVADKAGNPGNVLSWQFGVGTSLQPRLTAEQGRMRLNGEPFFPIGIYAYACHPDDGRFRDDHLAQAAAAGFNLVLNTIEKQAGLDRELAHGIMGTLNLTAELRDCGDPGTAAASLFGQGQGRFADHPAVVAFWADDPENVEDTAETPVSPGAVAKLRNAAAAWRQRAPGVPAIFAISNLPRLEPAMRYGDILLSYRYAVPHYHPAMIHGYTLAICQATVPDRPLWFLSQAIDLGYGASLGVPDFRPTPAEMEAMAFYSLVCGVAGYAIYANTINAADYPQHWTTLLALARRLRHLAPALAAGTPGRSVTLGGSPQAGAVLWRELEDQGLHTLLAVNLSAGTVAAVWEFGRPVQAAALFEGRAMAREADRVREVFDPWQVHVYQWR